MQKRDLRGRKGKWLSTPFSGVSRLSAPIVNGRVVGRVRGLKVRLSATARVEGDIVHKTIAIESGAHFEGSVQRQEDPLGNGITPKLAPPQPIDLDD